MKRFDALSRSFARIFDGLVGMGSAIQPKSSRKTVDHDTRSRVAVDGFSVLEIQKIDERALKTSRSLASKKMDNLAKCGPGPNIALGVGQSFMGGSANSQRLNLTSDRMLRTISYRAMMLGAAERCQTSGTQYDQFGPPVFNPLQETLVYQSKVFDHAQVRTGTFNPRAKGATPIVGACLLFERLWRTYQKVTKTHSPGFDVAVNVSKAEASIVQISTSPAIDRTFDAIDRIKAAASVEFPDHPVVHAVTLERHGQNGESSGNTQADYTRYHRAFRSAVNYHASLSIGNDSPAPWIATQVSGAYGSPRRRVAQAQLSMSLQDDDYFIATPDYPFPHFGKVKPPHPRAGDRHPTADGQLLASVYMAWARFYVQVLGRNWFAPHIGEAYFRGSSILVSFRAMKPPLRISEVCVSTTMTMIHALGFDVEDEGIDVPIIGTPELVGDLTFRIECDRTLKAPFIGTAKGSFGLADIGAQGSGATNIRDSQSLKSLFRPVFEEGYTDVLPGGLFDATSAEKITEMPGKQDMGIWALAQRKACKPMPSR